MPLRKPKTLTPADRMTAANEQTATALFVFEQAAVTLEMAADDYAVIQADLQLEALDLQARAAALIAQSDVAGKQGIDAYRSADKIRSLVGTASA